MRKLSLATIAAFFKLLSAFSQTPPPDSAAYADRKLHLEEVNFVSSYYVQDGENSAVTGGIGSEYLTDFSSSLNLKWTKKGKQNLAHTFNFDLGVDAYSSASSDKIDFGTVSSASASDVRIYPSLNWTVANEKTGWSAGITPSFSTEYDYKSVGLGLNVAKVSEDNNRELSVKLQAYWDTWKVILPIELRRNGQRDEGSAPRNSYSASLTYSFVVTPRLQAALLADGIYQEGLLATRYQRVFFGDNNRVQAEVLPDKRLKLPLGARLNYFAGSRIVLRSYYRYYVDDWGIRAHTASLEVPVKINPFLSMAPFYRYYGQTEARYFAPFKEHLSTQSFFTSDYDLSRFTSHFGGLNVRYVPEKGVFGIQKWKEAELRYGYYRRSNGLYSHVVTVGVGFR